MEKTLPQVWYREPWPWILMSGPAIVVVAGVITAWIAIAGADALVADDYYRQGLAVNRVLALEQAAATRGVTARVEPSGAQWRVTLAGGHGAPAALFAGFAHATRAGHDVRVRLARVGPDVYAGDAPPAVPGRWRVSLEDPQRRWRLASTWSGSSEIFALGARP